MDWRDDEGMGAAQRAVCEWLEAHDIAPHLTPRRGATARVTIEGDRIVAEQYYEDENGRRHVINPDDPNRILMAEPVTRRIVQDPPPVVRAWLRGAA